MRHAEGGEVVGVGFLGFPCLLVFIVFVFFIVIATLNFLLFIVIVNLHHVFFLLLFLLFLLWLYSKVLTHLSLILLNFFLKLFYIWFSKESTDLALVLH